MKAVLCTSAGVSSVIEVSELEEMQQAVGGYIESITVPGPVCVVVNEEGRLKNLPPNRTATEFIAMQLQDAVVMLVGDVLILGPTVKSNFTDVPAIVEDWFMAKNAKVTA